MKRTVSALFLVLCMLCSVYGFAESGRAEKTVPLYNEGIRTDELTICFFDETPNVPYMGINEYATHIMNSPMTLEWAADGTVSLKNDRRGELICDVNNGVIFTWDWIRVITPQTPLENDPVSLKDSSCDFVRITEITYEGDPAPITFDFAKYGMRIYADDGDVYLPLSVLSNMLTDIATNHLRYDGKALYQGRIETNADPNDPILMNEAMQARLAGEAVPDDVVKQCYADLCFNFDYFFGHPGVAVLDEAIAEKGLDQALTDLGEEGAAIKAGLLSNDMMDYVSALQKLFLVYLSDGHTAATDLSILSQSPALNSNPGKRVQIAKEFFSGVSDSKNTLTQILHMAITPQRRLAWGDEVYRESGNTAIIRLDTFMPDQAAWEKWYRGEGDFPQDCVGIVVSGLRRASENAEIRNVIFDLTCNGGGSSDVLMMIVGLTTGRNQLLGRNRLTGQTMVATFETDNNFDGLFDEKDAEARFDFNYGVLTSRQAFSCGNLFPIVMRESGAVVIGETTSGGSCCIQIGTDSHGLRYTMSSCQWQLLDAAGRDVEAGCTVDIPIRTGSVALIDRLIQRLGVDEGLPFYGEYFDEENLDTLMNAWFHVEAALPPAA